jgi:hypothetical protein
MSDGLIGEHSLLAPDLTEPLVGFRGWNLDDEYLVGPFKYARWGRITQAFCDVKSWPKHKLIPDEECQCGLYSYFDSGSIHRTGWMGVAYGGKIRGAVVSTGRVGLHEHGLRSQKARIVCLVEEKKSVEYLGGVHEFRALASRYNVPVVGPDALEDFAYEYGTPVPDVMMERVKKLNEDRRAERQARYEAAKRQRAIEDAQIIEDSARLIRRTVAPRRRGGMLGRFLGE